MVDPNQKVSYGFQFLSQVEEKGPGRGGVGDGVAGGERASGPQQQVLAPSIPRRTAADILAARYTSRKGRKQIIGWNGGKRQECGAKVAKRCYGPDFLGGL
jgi:hypothetical protein